MCDYAEIKGDGIITEQIAHKALTMLQVDENGLDEMDRRLLTTLSYPTRLCHANLTRQTSHQKNLRLVRT